MSLDYQFHMDQFSDLKISSLKFHTFLPKEIETVERFFIKVFCGTYSKDGNVFGLGVSQESIFSPNKFIF